MALIALSSGLSLRRKTVLKDVATESDILSCGVSLRRMTVLRDGDTANDILASGVALQHQTVQRGGGGQTEDILSRGLSAGYAKEIFSKNMDDMKDLTTTVTRIS